MDFSSESPEDNKLDNDFRRILCIIKQYIPYINSNHQLILYRSWLEKLSTAENEKMERNIYLFELARQIRSKRLLPPFDNYPPPGPLRNLPKINFFKPSNVENIIYDSPEMNKGCLSPPHPEQIPSTMNFVEENYSYPQQIYPDQVQRNVQPPLQMKHLFDLQDDYTRTLFVQPCYYHPCYAEDGSDTPTEKNRPNSKMKKRKSKSARSVQKLSVVARVEKPPECQQNFVQTEPVAESGASVKDDSSWCDLTDASQTSVNFMASGDNQISPPKVQEKAKQFGGMLKALERSKMTKRNESHTDKDAYEKNNFNLCSDDVDKISRKTQDLNQAKHSLKDTNFISSDWKKTIEGLQLRLTETLNQNNELKSIINALQLKLKDESSKNKEQNGHNQKKCELHKREIEALQQIQKDNIKKLEKSFHAKLGEAEKNFQKKMEKLKGNYETKIGELHVKHERSKREKDQEMCRLSEIIQQQCIRMSNEIAALRHQIENVFSNRNNNDDKITVLQKCVSKMDKLFVRSEKEYQKQIDKLKQELDLKDKVMQIQLKTQRAELIARTSVEKQKQFDEVINNLEIKYIKMLEFHETQVMEVKEQDEEKIEQLKYLLDENNIAYNNVL